MRLPLGQLTQLWTQTRRLGILYFSADCVILLGSTNGIHPHSLGDPSCSMLWSPLLKEKLHAPTIKHFQQNVAVLTISFWVKACKYQNTELACQKQHLYIHNVEMTVPGLESSVFRLPPFFSLLKLFDAENTKQNGWLPYFAVSFTSDGLGSRTFH